jgi:hypothetical protein
LIGALGTSRAGVLLVDRHAGRVYGEAHRRSLMQGEGAAEPRAAGPATSAKSTAPAGPA